MASQYWIRTGKKVQGPFSGKQLIYWASINKLKRNHLISIDRIKWVPAARVKGLRWPENSPANESQTQKDKPNQHQITPAHMRPQSTPAYIASDTLTTDTRITQRMTHEQSAVHPGTHAIPNNVKIKLVPWVARRPNVTIIYGALITFLGLLNLLFLIFTDFFDDDWYPVWIITAIQVELIIHATYALVFGISLKTGNESIQKVCDAGYVWTLGIFLFGWATLYLFAGGWKQTWGGTIWGIWAYLWSLKYIYSGLVISGVVAHLNKTAAIQFYGPAGDAHTLTVFLECIMGKAGQVVPALLDDHLIALVINRTTKVPEFKHGSLEFCIKRGPDGSMSVVSAGKSFELGEEEVEHRILRPHVLEAPLGPLNELSSIRKIRKMLIAIGYQGYYRLLRQ